MIVSCCSGRALSTRSGSNDHGRLYPNLDTLVEEGYVEKGSIDDRTNSYELTPEGQALLADRHEWEGKQLSEGDDE